MAGRSAGRGHYCQHWPMEEMLELMIAMDVELTQVSVFVRVLRWDKKAKVKLYWWRPEQAV